MKQNSRRQRLTIAVVLALFLLVTQAAMMGQNLGAAPAGKCGSSRRTGHTAGRHVPKPD